MKLHLTLIFLKFWTLISISWHTKAVLSKLLVAINWQVCYEVSRSNILKNNSYNSNFARNLSNFRTFMFHQKLEKAPNVTLSFIWAFSVPPGFKVWKTLHQGSFCDIKITKLCLRVLVYVDWLCFPIELFSNVSCIVLNLDRKQCKGNIAKALRKLIRGSHFVYNFNSALPLWCFFPLFMRRNDFYKAMYFGWGDCLQSWASFQCTRFPEI